MTPKSVKVGDRITVFEHGALDPPIEHEGVVYSYYIIWTPSE